jgi:hypothetical protein
VEIRFFVASFGLVNYIRAEVSLGRRIGLDDIATILKIPLIELEEALIGHGAIRNAYGEIVFNKKDIAEQAIENYIIPHYTMKIISQ